jgi:hypothetical protein
MGRSEEEAGARLRGTGDGVNQQRHRISQSRLYGFCSALPASLLSVGV